LSKDDDHKSTQTEIESQSTQKESLAPEQEDIFKYIAKEIDKDAKKKKKGRPVPRLIPGDLTCALNIKPT
jgi:hypothetical protein